MPPLAYDIYRSIRGGGIQFNGVYPDWVSAQRQSEGYDADQILEKVRVASHKVLRGEVVWERDSVVFDAPQYPFPVISMLLRAAFENDGTLNVLDFGGALGSSYYQSRDFLNKVKSVKWCVVEQPNFVECGKREFQFENLLFNDNLENMIKDVRPNLILASGVLQYMSSPREILDIFSHSKADYIVIDRTPIAINGNQVISVQSVPSEINKSSYPLWLFNENILKEPLLTNYNEMASFPAVDGKLGNGTLKAVFKGFIFQKKI